MLQCGDHQGRIPYKILQRTLFSKNKTKRVFIVWRQTAMMIYRNGAIDDLSKIRELSDFEIDKMSIKTNTHLGETIHLGPITKLSKTPPSWQLPTPNHYDNGKIE